MAAVVQVDGLVGVWTASRVSGGCYSVPNATCLLPSGIDITLPLHDICVRVSIPLLFCGPHNGKADKNCPPPITGKKLFLTTDPFQLFLRMVNDPLNLQRNELVAFAQCISSSSQTRCTALNLPRHELVASFAQSLQL